MRQSTAKQVLENVESTDRQYALVERATSLGWPASAVELIDEDLGQSGSSTVWRPGFKRMTEQVTQGKVGAIFALDVSRFARSSADWHPLLFTVLLREATKRGYGEKKTLFLADGESQLWTLRKLYFPGLNPCLD